MTAVGVVGIGRMGSAMARSLARDGLELVLYNRSPERARALADELGARVATSPAEVAAAVDVCLTMLADRPAVEATWSGADGIVAGAHAGSVLVDMSTVPPETLLGYAEEAGKVGAGVLDAPVSGSVALAESGQLTVMAGGEREHLERARPVLDRLAKQVFHIGPLGSGAAMKLAVNAVIFGLNNALSEALVLAERAGIDRWVAYEVIAKSAAGAPFVGYKQAAFLEPDATPVAFALELAEKDLRLISELATSVALDAPQLRANVELTRAASEAVGGERDFSAVAVYLRDGKKGGAPG